MHYQLIFFVFCFFICPLHAMHPEIISDSQKRFENMPFVFTLTDAFAKQKRQASDCIAQLLRKKITVKTIWGTEKENLSYSHVVFNSDGSRIAAACNALFDNNYKHIFIIDVHANKIIKKIRCPFNIEAITFSPDGLYLAVSCSSYMSAEPLILINVTSGLMRKLNPIAIPRFVHDIIFDSNESLTLMDYEQDDKYRINIKTGATVVCHGKQTIMHNNGLLRIDIGRWGMSQAVQVIDIVKKRIKYSMERNPAWLHGVQISPDGSLLATENHDPRITDLSLNSRDFCVIKDVATNKRLYRLEHPNWVQSASFDPNGIYFATSCFTDGIRIFNLLETAHIVNTLSLAQSELLQAFRITKRDCSRIHANDEQWQTWLRLKKILPSHAVKKLKPHIVYDDPTAGYETPDEYEQEKSSCIIS